MTHSTQNNQYFDLHTSGIGYLNRIRNVTVRKGKPFLAVTVAALHGATENIEYTYIDCRVTGASRFYGRATPCWFITPAWSRSRTLQSQEPLSMLAGHAMQWSSVIRMGSLSPPL